MSGCAWQGACWGGIDLQMEGWYWYRDTRGSTVKGVLGIVRIGYRYTYRKVRMVTGLQELGPVVQAQTFHSCRMMQIKQVQQVILRDEFG